MKHLLVYAFVMAIFLPGTGSAEEKCQARMTNSQFDEKTIKVCTAEINSGASRGNDLAILHLGRGLAYKEIRQYDDAIADMGKALRLVSGIPSLTKVFNVALADVHVLRGETHYNAGKYDSGIADFGTAVSLNPSLARAYCYRSSAFLKKSIVDKARVDNDSALALGWVCNTAAPGKDDPCSTYTTDGEYEKAVKQCTEDINSGLFSRGDLAAKLVDRAWSYYIGFKDGKISMDYGLLLGKAMTDLNRAIEISPSYSYAYAVRGWIRKAKASYQGPASEYPLAITDLSTALKLDPSNSFAYKGRGRTYVGQAIGHSSEAKTAYYDLAIADFTSAIGIDPLDSDAYEDRGQTYSSKGEYEAALRDLNKAIEINPSAATAYCTRADVQKNIGNAEKAGADYRRARELGDDLCFKQ